MSLHSNVHEGTTGALKKTDVLNGDKLHHHIASRTDGKSLESQRIAQKLPKDLQNRFSDGKENINEGKKDTEIVSIDSINQQLKHDATPINLPTKAQCVPQSIPKQSSLSYSLQKLKNGSKQHEAVHNKTEQTSPSIITISRAPMLKVVPPLNFCPVERYLYRSGQPTPINHTFLKQLNIRNIVWLASEDPSDDFLEFADINDINVHYIGGMNSDDGTTNPWDGLSQNSITQALQIIANKNYYPILVCCGMGRHRTGTVIGCLRRLQGWNLASVSEEYRRFTGSKGGRILVELLIEAFDIKSIKIDPQVAPDWLLS